MHITIHKDFYDNGDKIFDRASFELDPGLTILVGCNGAGKSTILLKLQEHCREHDIPCIKFNTLHDGGNNFSQMLLDRGMCDHLAQYMMSSEGERISHSLGGFVTKLNKFMDANGGEPDLVILIDSVDSGLSLDNIVEIKRWIFHRIIEENEHNTNLYIVVSANAYEMVRGERCLLAQDLQYTNIDSYERYRKVIIRSRNKKNKRYGWDKFEDK